MGNRIHYFFWRQTTRDRAIICLILGLIVWMVVYRWHPWQIALLSAWIVSLGNYLMAQAVVILSANGSRTQQRVSQYKPNGWAPLTTAILVALVSNIILGLLLTEVGHRSTFEARIVIALSVIAVVLSWIMLNVSFGKHYARLYYNNRDHAGNPLPEGEIYKGFHFPGTEQPTYLDFMYVAQTIALTYSMSDVSITTARIRQIVLAHSLISFLFYSIVIGSVLNAIVTS
jgi:uncharacterized membrane protein